MNYTLIYLSNGTKNTQIKVQMTKLWPYKVGVKTGDCSNVATLKTNISTLKRVKKQSIPTLQRCCTMSGRLGLILGQLLAHFKPIIVGFKAQTRRRQGKSFWWVWKGGNTLGHGSIWGRRWIEENIWASFITLGYLFSLIFMVVSFPLMDLFSFSRFWLYF